MFRLFNKNKVTCKNVNSILKEFVNYAKIDKHYIIDRTHLSKYLMYENDNAICFTILSTKVNIKSDMVNNSKILWIPVYTLEFSKRVFMYKSLDSIYKILTSEQLFGSLNRDILTVDKLLYTVSGIIYRISYIHGILLPIAGQKVQQLFNCDNLLFTILTTKETDNIKSYYSDSFQNEVIFGNIRLIPLHKSIENTVKDLVKLSKSREILAIASKSYAKHGLVIG